MKALGLVVSEKKIFLGYAPRAGAVWTPGARFTLVNHYVDLRCLRRFYGDSYADLLEKNGGAHEVNTENNW